MRKLIFAIILIVSALLAASAPVRTIEDDLSKTWIKIDSLESAGLYRSALNLAEQVYRDSRLHADQENEIKSLIYRLKYTQELEEDGNITAIGILQKDLEDERLVPGALKASIMGELLQRFYITNRWEISQRPDDSDASTSPADIDLFKAGPSAIYKSALNAYKESLSGMELLAKIPVTSIKGLFSGSLSDTINQPTLLDLLMTRAIGFLEQSDDYPVMSLRPVILCSKELFADKKTFVEIFATSPAADPDPWSQTLVWYAQWLRLSPGNLSANLKRLEFARSVSCHSGAEQLYVTAISNLLPEYENKPQSAGIYETLANYHLERAGRFQINAPDTQEFMADRKLARSWLEKAVVWDETKEGLNCKNLLTSLLKPEFSVLTESVQIPGAWFPVSIEYRNIDKLFFRIYRINPLIYQSEWQQLEPAEKISKLSGHKITRKGEWLLFRNNDLNPHRINQLVEPLPPGFYLMAISSEKDCFSGQGTTMTASLTVSGITLVSRVKEQASREFYFRDRATGEPLKGIRVTPYYGEYDPEGRRSVLNAGQSNLTEAEGRLVLNDTKSGRRSGAPDAYRILAINGYDTLLTQESFYPGYGNLLRRKTTSAQVFTDRALYKPGSRIWFRGIMVDRTGDSLSVHNADSIQITVQDPRYQVISQFRLPVDSLGVFSGFADLPDKGLTGNYSILTPFGSASVSMEQYSRPGFSVQISPVKQAYLNGDTMKLDGKVVALSGEPVADAEVLVGIDLARAMSPRGYWPGTERRTRIHTARIRTSQNGEFVWNWKTISEESNPFGPGTILDYEVSFLVTDLSGETHQEKIRVLCGKGSTGVRIDSPTKVVLGDTLRMRVNSSNGAEVPVEVCLSRLADFSDGSIESLLPEPDRFVISKKEWKKRVPFLPYRKNNTPGNLPVKELVAKIHEVSDQKTGVILFTGTDWSEGWYKIELTSVNPAVRNPEPRFIYLHKPVTGKVTGDRELFAEVSSSSVRTGEKLVLKQGSLRKGFILTQLQLPDGTMVDWWSESGRKMVEASWTVDSSWQGGAAIALLMVRNNRVYQERFLIDVPREHVRLSVDGLKSVSQVKPGDSIRLRLHVSDESGRPVSGSMAITVYDASLDQIKKHGWPQILWPRFNGYPGFEAMMSFASESLHLIDSPQTWVEVPYSQPIDLNWWGMGYYGIARLDAAMPVRAAAAESGTGSKALKTNAPKEDDQVVIPEVSAGETVPVEIRKDFSETAIFVGQMVTDKNGDADVRFKVPDVFTEWKVLVTVHTPAMATGFAEHSFKSSKELMLKPNFPSFLRQGDTLQLVSRIGWYGKNPLSPESKLTMNFTGDGSGRVEFSPMKMTLQPSSADLLTFDYRVPKPGRLVYNLVSTAGNISDGMQDTLTVYPDKALLWRSQSFFLNKKGNKILKMMAPPVKAQVEITTTPAWQVLLSIPAVIYQERDCSEYWFSRLYLAGITGSIGEKFPEAKEFYLDHSEEEILDSLNHPLTRNQGIKGRAWETSPWSQVVKNERNRIAQIRKWMNSTDRNTEMSYSLEKISSLQNSDGSWPWFRGMGPDWYTTMQIVAGFGELKGWQVLDVTATQRGNFMIAKALEGLDGWMGRRFREIMRQDSTGNLKVQLDPMLIQYLYTRSFYSGWTVSPRDELAWIYFMERIPLEWTSHDPGLQALMAIALVQSGRMPQARPIYLSLRERMAESDEMGAWWPKKGFGSDWYQWDIWMQSKMIELFAGMEDGRKDLDKLRLYLVQQKRGRDWGNGLVAAWASKSLLFFGSGTEIKPAQVGFKWGGDVFSSLRVKTGSTGPQGYYRFNWETQESIPKEKTVEFSHAGDSPAWGALFTLEEHRLDELQSTGGPLSLQRSILIRKSGNDWEILKPGQVVSPGTRARVRLEVKSDRQLSYVELKDYLGTGFKPVKVLSGYQYQSGVSWYQAREPESVLFYIAVLPKGRHILEYEVLIEQAGNYFGGYAEAQSLYAPEFRAWSNSSRVKVAR